MGHFQLNSEISIEEDYDVIVFGGGTAGTIAAIQAARAGARTAIIEKNSILGGTSVVASVNFPGLFHAWTKQVIAGIGWEVIEETVRRGGATLPDFSVQYPGLAHPKHQILVNRFLYARVMEEMCVHAGVDIRYHEMPVAIQSDVDHRVVVIAGKSGLSAVRTQIMIDATGDANVAGLMGYERTRGDKLQPGSLIYELDGYQMDNIDPHKLQLIYDQALLKGEISIADHVVGVPPFWRELTNRNCSMHVPGIDGSTSQSRTHAELKARQALARIYALLRKVPGCEQLYIRSFANECGIRETWRITGEQYVTHEAYTSGYVWEDAVCYSFYPIDVHHDHDNTIDIRPLPEGNVATIPYGALVPRGSDYLLVAGRCISGDREASSAYRVQASCMAMGQAAGAAAAIAALQKIPVRQVSLPELKSILLKHHAIVP